MESNLTPTLRYLQSEVVSIAVIEVLEGDVRHEFGRIATLHNHGIGVGWDARTHKNNRGNTQTICSCDASTHAEYSETERMVGRVEATNEKRARMYEVYATR